MRERIVSSVKDIGINWVVTLKQPTLKLYVTPYKNKVKMD